MNNFIHFLLAILLVGFILMKVGHVISAPWWKVFIPVYCMAGGEILFGYLLVPFFNWLDEKARWF